MSPRDSVAGEGAATVYYYNHETVLESSYANASHYSRRKNTRTTGIIFVSAAAGLLLLTASYLGLLGGMTPHGAPAIGGPFTLIKGNGQVVSRTRL